MESENNKFYGEITVGNAKVLLPMVEYEKYVNGNKDVISGWENILEALSSSSKGCEELKYNNGWIAVSDRLPELDESVLLFDHWGSHDKEMQTDIRVGYLSEFTTRKTSGGVTHSCEWGGTEFTFNITHWMPLPKPPKV